MPSRKQEEYILYFEDLEDIRSICEYLGTKGKYGLSHSYQWRDIKFRRWIQQMFGDDVRLIFYSTGWGWRRHKFWEEKIAWLEAVCRGADPKTLPRPWLEGKPNPYDVVLGGVHRDPTPYDAVLGSQPPHPLDASQ